MSSSLIVDNEISLLPRNVASATCWERKLLFGKCCHARADYKRASEVLELRQGVLHKSDYDALRQAADRYGLTYAEAREKLDRHVAEHGCLACVL